ncbi:MAG: S8 family serine peptidase [Blastocatellia bacterium]
MKKNYPASSTSLLLALALVVPMLLTGLQVSHADQDQRAVTPARREPSRRPANDAIKSRKLSPDLEVAATRADDDAPVRTILQVRNPQSENLKQLLKRHGIRVHRKMNDLQMMDVELPKAVLNELAESDDVQFVSANQEVKALGHLTTTTGAEAVRNQTRPDGKTYKLDGTGIGIAIIDSGIDKEHKAIADGHGLKVSVDFTGQDGTEKDPYGHGTHVAGLATGVGNFSNNVYTGIAPGADVINLRVLDSNGVGTVSGVLAALNWVLANSVRYKIGVVNMSLGTPAVTSYVNDPICIAVRRLVDAGIVVVAAAGNDGKDDSGQPVYGRIHSPGIEPSAITVGCSNSLGTDSRGDDSVASYSSRGPTRGYWTDADGVEHYDNLVKPDLVAPGNKVIQAEAKENFLIDNYPQLETNVYSDDHKRVMYLSGTSMAAPQVAGAAALLLQVNPKLTPMMVKAILMYTAQPLAGYNLLEQGAGELNIEGAVRLAKLVRTDLTATTTLGSPLLTTATPPVPQTTIAGSTFTWAQGIIGDYSYITGTDLITRYQLIFGQGHLLANAILLANGHLLANSTQVTNGVLVGDTILTSNGYSLGNGTSFLNTMLLLGNGTLLPEGHLLANGTVQGDGHLLANQTYQSLSVLVDGDNTSCMR